jgi:flagella basal body P-ring formation protein FlgA
MTRAAQILALALAAVLIAGPALAGPVTLRADVSDDDGRVTFGDLFEGAGGASDMVIANRGGSTVVLDAAAVQSMARRAGLQWDNPQGYRRIVVRSGAAQAGSVGSSFPLSGPSQASRGNVDVLTYARSLSAGEIVQPEDLVWAKAAGAPVDAPNDADGIIGLAAKRPLRAGSLVSARDVSAPVVIKAGDLVAVTWSDGAVSLTMQGRAMKTAARGDTVIIQNTASKKVVEAIAIGPGQAVSGPDAQRLKVAGAQFTAR